MLIAVLSGFAISLLLVPFGRFLKNGLPLLVSLLPIVLFAYFASYIPAISQGETISTSYAWVPSLGVNFDFHLDGLSLLFTLLITGIGSLVFLYTSSYLKGHPYIDRFYAYLSMFMAAMLGLVLADNVLLLFVFWELTSISSFFLIGFNNDNAASRRSSLVALTITGGGGFLLLAAVVMMARYTGSFSIQDMISQSDILRNHVMYGWMLGFLFAGAFTKSAQFPFHFWLPGAMKAPTPVSAYLHSATMVKAGVYLLARMFPVLGGTDLWTYPLVIIGGLTMVYAAFHSLFRTDLKGVLAYSTIAALGILVFLIGIGTPESLVAATVFILVHALYKASLFLITGVIDHETGSRDASWLSGLRKVMFPLAVAGLLAALSSAGLPFTFGFIGKDLIYESTLQTGGSWAIGLTAVALVTNICLLYAGLVAGVKPFAGPLPDKLSSVHLPQATMWVPPLLLAILGLLFGCFPNLVDGALLNPAAASIAGQTVLTQLKIWHGFNLVLLLSAVTLVAGAVLYWVLKPSATRINWLKPLQKIAPERLFSGFYHDIIRMSYHYTNTLHNGYLRKYLFTIICFTTVLLGYKLFVGGNIHIDINNLSPIRFYEVAVGITLVGAVFLAILTPSRLTSVVALSVMGLCICLLFLFYSAPDLAMTQFTIDTLTVVLFVLVLFRLPPYLNFANHKVKLRDTILASVFGLFIAMIAMQVLAVPKNTEISDFYGDNAYLLAKGKNVVNVILVDFRGMDTMFEIVVLSIAAIGVFSLLKLRLKPSEKE